MIRTETAMAYKRQDRMTFKCLVLHTADSANIQWLGPVCACAVNADGAAYWR